jgi:hypothetical protein
MWYREVHDMVEHARITDQWRVEAKKTLATALDRIRRTPARTPRGEAIKAAYGQAEEPADAR